MISVCMASYNGGLYIKQQVLSILSQLGEEDELIISDDCSSDNTLEILGEINDSRLNVFSFKRDRSKYKSNFHLATSNFEHALSKAKGDYIFISDQDDVWLPDKVKTCMKYLQQYDLVVHDCYVVDTNLNVILPSYFQYRKVKTGFFRNLVKSRYLGCCMALKRELLLKALPFPVTIGHDIWISLLGELLYDCHCIPDKLLLYRRHDNNTSPTTTINKNSFIDQLLFRLTTVKNIIIRIIELKKKNKVQCDI